MVQVWQAFSKFIASQIRNGRVLDTQVSGIFRMKGEQPEFLPSPDYLDGIKLKLKDYPLNEYPDTYSEVAKGAVPINFSSIAVVCAKGTKSETVYSILKQTFSKVIENPKDRGLTLNMVNLGAICYNPS